MTDREMTDAEAAQVSAMFHYPSPDIENAAELRSAYVAGWMARDARGVDD